MNVLDYPWSEPVIAAALVPETATPRPLLEKLESLEGERQALEAQAAALNVEATTSRTVAALDDQEIHQARPLTRS